MSLTDRMAEAEKVPAKEYAKRGVVFDKDGSVRINPDVYLRTKKVQQMLRDAHGLMKSIRAREAKKNAERQ